MTHTLSILVENNAGVLARVSGLFARRSFNIDSLAVGVTDDPSISRITIVVHGNEHTVEQIEKQLNKLIDVIKVKSLDEGEFISRELMMIKVNASAAKRSEVMTIAEIAGAKGIGLLPQHINLGNLRHRGAACNFRGLAHPLWDKGNSPHWYNSNAKGRKRHYIKKIEIWRTSKWQRFFIKVIVIYHY